MKKNGLHIDEYGTKCWYKNGLAHREDGPAVIDRDGTQYWYKDGSLHREDGPAVIRPSGYMAWYRHNRWHRDDGPARVWPDGITPQWYKHGSPYIPSSHEIMTWKMNEKERTTY